MKKIINELHELTKEELNEVSGAHAQGHQFRAEILGH